MGSARSVVVTGASRGLGLATATYLHRAGWTVVAAMRSPTEGMERLRAATGAGPDDARLIAIQLDLDDPESVAHAGPSILDRVGAPHGIVHNAGIAGVGSLEEMPMPAWEQIVSTNFFGPVRLTKELLPAMRAAGSGRIVLVSSMGAVHGMPGIGAYSAAKAALERWGEALSQEIAQFGLGVTVLVAGSFRTDILELTETHADPVGPYAEMHGNLEARGRRLLRFARTPDRFAPAVARALGEKRPFTRRGVGVDARMLLIGSRVMPTAALQWVTRRVLRLPGPGSAASGSS